MLESKASSEKVLVIDDNEQNRELARATLDDEGYRVLLARGGEEGIAIFERELPDCVLLDVKMPGTDGLAVCRRIRAHEAGGNTPIVFLTALRDVGTFDDAQSAGGDDFLTKPVHPAELIVRVQAALRLRRLTVENRDYYETVRQQRDALMRLQLQKEQLMDFVVHDLKNPATTMDLHAQLLHRDTTLSEQARRSVTAIRGEARLLMRMITNLLDISRSESGMLVPRLERLDASAIVGDILGMFAARARDKNVALGSNVAALFIRADADLVRRVLENLIDNALRHAPDGSAISVDARVVGDGVELRVVDRGSGIPEALRERVFERFAQLGAPGGQRVGYGLGLAFCKHAIELLGGTIWVEDGAPGAVFCLRLQRDS